MISRNHAMILATLDHHGPLTVRDIYEDWEGLAGLKNSINGSLRSLEEQGLVRRLDTQKEEGTVGRPGYLWEIKKKGQKLLKEWIEETREILSFV